MALLHERAGPASLMSWLKQRLGHGLSEEGGKTCFDYHVFHTFAIGMPWLSEKCHFATVVVMAMALGLRSWSIFVE